MTHPEKAAQKLRHANEKGAESSHDQAADAQHEINRPENAKGRPATGRQSNAGRDGGA